MYGNVTFDNITHKKNIDIKGKKPDIETKNKNLNL